MKKLFLLLAMVGMLAVACQSGGVDDENGGKVENPIGSILVSPAMLNVDYEEENYSLSINATCAWMAETDNPAWIVIDNTTGIVGAGQLRFKVLRNEEKKERVGTIFVKNSAYNQYIEIYITQKAFVPSELSVSPKSLNFECKGGSKSVAITANFDYEVGSSASWVTCKKTEQGVTVSVPNYDEVESRTADVTISNKKYNISEVIKVTQTAFVPKLEISATATSYEYDFTGGEFTVAVVSNFDYDVSTTADWVECTKDAKGVKVSVLRNVNESRNAEVRIYSEKYSNLEGAKITINQTGYPRIGSLVTKNGATGVVFYVDESVVKIVSVSETKLEWSTEKVETGAGSRYNGANNMAIIKSISGWEDKYPAFKWCSDYGEGWYLPAIGELEYIYKTLRTVNATLEANGYITIGGYYWSSTEYSSDVACLLNFSSGFYYYNKVNTYDVRAVLAF